MAGRATVAKPRETVTVDAKDITWIKDILKQLSEKVEAIDKTTTKLNTTIVGDPAYGQVGLVTQVNEHAKYIEDDKSFKSKVVGGGLVLGVVWTVVLKFWDKIF